MRTQSLLAAILTLALVAVLAIEIPHNPGSPYGRLAAASVTPELHFPQGNLTCNDVEGAGQNWTELKVDPNTDGSHTDGTLTVNITHTTFDKVFDWTSNIGVDGVIVKAGSAGTHFYRYDPPGESTGDTGLTSPGADHQNAISHIAFCYDTNDPTATATHTPVPPSATATDTPTNTPVPPTATSTSTSTNTPLTPTATGTDTPTNTPTNTPTDPPTSTSTDTPTDTPTATYTPSPTNTAPGDPTATDTPTSTPVTPIATNTPPDEPNATPTDTPVPPTNTATSEPSATATSISPDPGDPTPTNTTPPDPTATDTTPPSDPTATSQPPSDPTATSQPPSDPTATNPPPTDAPPTIIAPTSPPSTPTATAAPVCATNDLPTLTVSAAPAQALPGAEVVYTVRVANPHAANLTQVSLATSFTGLAEFVSTTATQGQPLHPAGTNSVSLALASLGSGQSVEMTIRVRLAANAPASSQVTVGAGAAVNGLTCQQASAAVTITPAGIPVTGGGPGWAELQVIVLVGLVLFAGSVWASRQLRKRLVGS